MEEEKRIISYKGFDENLCCRGFQSKSEKNTRTKARLNAAEVAFTLAQTRLTCLIIMMPMVKTGSVL